MNDSFNDAQQAANVAYDMTLAETHDIEQAADAYKSVMSAYMVKAFPTQPREYIENVREIEPTRKMADKTVNAYNNWQAFIAKCNDTDSGSQWADRGADHE